MRLFRCKAESDSGMHQRTSHGIS